MADVLNTAKDLFNKSRIAEVPGKTLEGLKILDKVAGAPVKLGATLIGQGDKVPEGLGAQVDDVFGLPGRVATGFNKAVPPGFSQQAGDATTAVTGSPLAGGIVGLGAGLVEPIPGPEKAAKGISTLSELTTKVADRIGSRAVVSRQFIEDLAKAPDIKAPEKDAIAKALADGGEDRNVDVATFKNRLENELLPLTHSKYEIPSYSSSGEPQLRDKYESIALPDDVKGPVASYYENIYQSPIENSTGSVHFDNPNYNKNSPTGYFAHTRVEDLEPETKYRVGADILADARKQYDVKITPQDDVHYPGRLEITNKATGKTEMSFPLDPKETANPEATEADYLDSLMRREGKATEEAGSTRRIIEIQSDLYQRGRLANEAKGAMDPETMPEYKALSEKYSELRGNGDTKGADAIAKQMEQMEHDAAVKRQAELAPLEPYKNTWYERIIREETQQAAADGKTQIQVPTGETAMRVEGLAGDVGAVPDHAYDGDTFDYAGDEYTVLDRYGGEAEVVRTDDIENTFDYETARDEEIQSLADDLDYDARRHPEDLENRIPENAFNYLKMHGYDRFMENKSFKDTFQEAAEADINDRYHDASSFARYMNDNTGEEYRAVGDQIYYLGRHANTETMNVGEGELDIDKESPIYKFYQDDVGKYVKKRYGAREVTDENGVTWWQYDVPKEAARQPIEAFAAIPPLAIGAGAGMQVANSTPATIEKKKAANPPTQ